MKEKELIKTNDLEVSNNGSEVIVEEYKIPEVECEIRQAVAVEDYKYHLVVKSPFRDFKKGDMIFSNIEIKNIQSCHEHAMTTKVSN